MVVVKNLHHGTSDLRYQFSRRRGPGSFSERKLQPARVLELEDVPTFRVEADPTPKAHSLKLEGAVSDKGRAARLDADHPTCLRDA